MTIQTITMNLLEVKDIVEKLAQKISAPEDILPSYGDRRECHPNIEINTNGQFSLEIYEREEALRIDYALDLKHLLFLVFRQVTFSMAEKMLPMGELDIEAAKRIRKQKQLELLSALDPVWAALEMENYKAEKFQFPTEESKLDRSEYIRILMGQGYLYNEAVAKADKRGLE